MKDFIKVLAFMVVGGAMFMAAIFLVEKTRFASATVDNTSAGSEATSTYYASVSSAATGGCVILKGATSTFAGPANGRMSGVLENLIVPGGPKGGSIFFYDATTSNINLRTGNQASSSILLEEFPAGIATTTYMLNRTFKTGLLMCVVGTPSTSTVTWK